MAESNANLSIWDRVARPPAEALTRISGGRLSGKTDISPQWRIKVITETFGPVGTGWGYEITRLWTEPGSDGQVCAFARVDVRYRKDDGEWSEPIPGVGGSMLIVNEKSGPYTSDEAYKMAVTDALSVALKALGTAADIYMGLWDGSKYKTEAHPENNAEPAEPDGESGLANLFHVLAAGLKEGLLTAEEHAKTSLGLAAYIKKYPKATVIDYTTVVRRKLEKKRGQRGETRPETDDDRGKVVLSKTIDKMKTKAERIFPEQPPTAEEDGGLF